VIGLDSITGLQSARILARRGVPVIALSRDPEHYCCRTRVCKRIIEADTGSEEFIAVLQQLGPSLSHKAVLVPCSDMSVLLTARHKEGLQAWYHVDLPPADMVERLMDKVKFYRLAESHGLPVPKTFVLQDRGAAARAARELRFPCILKPALKTSAWEQHSPEKVYHVTGPERLLALFDRYIALAGALLVQEWIPGPESELYSCNCYFDARSRPLAAFVARKLRQWPPGTGTSCSGEECRNDEVLAQTLRLFTSIGFSGLGYVEMKRDSRDGRHYIIEPNIGRPTGRSAIAETGGVELLYTKYCDNVGWPLPEKREQAYRGVKWIHFRRDVQAALCAWRRGELTLREWWRSIRGKKMDAVFDWRDPRPFFSELLYAARKSFGVAGAEPQRGVAGAEPKRCPSSVAHARDAANAPTPATLRPDEHAATYSCADTPRELVLSESASS
jgi:predicted ATP-grasp superfamily ATP-dependent carboligase